ncbi:hypothetical protein OAN94_06480 [Verrucomicrobiales bacterium]|nr:hypothetical protein [Verrucomicrobiales bacterium]
MNLCYILFGIASEHHAEPFYVDLPGRKLDGYLSLPGSVEQLLV